MGRWDKPKETKTEKKIQSIIIKIFFEYKKRLPKILRKIDRKISGFIQKHCIMLSFRQWAFAFFGVHVFSWAFLPYLTDRFTTIGIKALNGDDMTVTGFLRIIISVLLLFLAFSIDRGDDDDDKSDEPPNDDGGMMLEIKDDQNKK